MDEEVTTTDPVTEFPDAEKTLKEPTEEIGDAEYRDQARFAEYIGSRVLQKISGTGNRRPEDRKSVIDRPSDRYFAGQLVSDEEAGHSDLDDEMQAKLNPSALQAEFLVDPEEASGLSVRVSGNIYYRTFPTFDEQVDETSVALGDQSEDESRSSDDEQDRFTPVYRRLRFETGPISVEIPSLEDVAKGEIRPAEIENQILGQFTDHLQSRIRELEASDEEPPVWRPSEHVDRPLSVSPVDEMDAPVDIDTRWDGEYTFPAGFLDVDDDEESRCRYQALIDELTAGPESEILCPPWDFDVTCEFSRRTENQPVDTDQPILQGTLVVENHSDANPDTKGVDSDYGRYDFDTTLFDVEARLELTTGDFTYFTFERLEEDFRYDRKIPGHGTNCTVVRPDGEPSGMLETEYLPTHRQQRFVTRDPESLDPVPDIGFLTLADLENGGLEALDDLIDAMEWYLEDYEKGFKKARTEYYEQRDDFFEEDAEDMARDQEAFRREIQRCRRAVKCLRSDIERASEDPDHEPRVARAFELMNQTFRSKVEGPDGEPEYESWRLFQLVFILRVLPDIATRDSKYEEWSEVTWRKEENQYTVDSESRNFNGDDMEALDLVDIVWFPTGGGKTEAYLGLAVFSAFFDRYRGKKYGVSAWTRFPLRLLSLQQTQRICEILMHAEMVRLEDPVLREKGGLPLSLGYLVGSSNTPNKLTSYTSAEYADDEDYIRKYLRYRDDKGLRDEKQVLPRCPVCESEATLRVTEDIRLAHSCTASPDECDWQQRNQDVSGAYQIFAGDELPVHVVDNEIYRYAPSMVVGTIDKIAAVDYERKSGHLYTGKMTHWCPDHGFASGGECTEKYGCHDRYGGDADPDDRLVPLSETPMGRPHDIAPTLQIQDELHLLEETLGTFDSHFETLIDTLQRENGQQRTKIIAATATIEEYDRQVRDLYLRKAERFPAPGPYNGENFYATTEETTRRQFCGIMPHGKTHINAVLDLMYHQTYEIETIREEIDSMGGDHPLVEELRLETVSSESEFRDLLSLYETTLSYCISNDEKDRLIESVRGQITDYMQREDLLTPLENELTGDTKFNEVEGILNNLEDPPKDPAERIDMLAATNMISHGVDVDRFNYMVFFGMPRQTAEYIQSSSRAGRKHPGLVMLCFNPARERDQSHYHMFEKYHEYLDRLVEAVPLNRWSHFSVKRTLPGMLFGWVLTQWWYESDENLYFGDPVEEIARALQPNMTVENSILEDLSIDTKDNVQTLLRQSYGADLNGELPEAFEQQMEDELDRALGNLENIDADMASEALNPPPMLSLRDIEEPIRIVPDTDTDKRIFRKMSQR
ncbi:helicase-related protein [Natrialba sp. PRR66]|uniref:helicase-related protein n=1 Tax=Natrialba sp. PRR66 TaxID=3098146 RepID=UPI002B1E7B78|nr:helicase-related protein [Natrialba sp. PRR66]